MIRMVHSVHIVGIARIICIIHPLTPNFNSHSYCFHLEALWFPLLFPTFVYSNWPTASRTVPLHHQNSSFVKTSLEGQFPCLQQTVLSLCFTLFLSSRSGLSDGVHTLARSYVLQCPCGESSLAHAVAQASARLGSDYVARLHARIRRECDASSHAQRSVVDKNRLVVEADRCHRVERGHSALVIPGRACGNGGGHLYFDEDVRPYLIWRNACAH